MSNRARKKAKPESLPPPSKPKIAFALGGGATHGAFTWGVLEKAYEDLDTSDPAQSPYDIVAYSGTSAGAINGAYATIGYKQGGAKGAIAMMKKCWMGNIAGRGFQSHPLALWFGYYDLEDNPFYKYYESFLKDFNSHATTGRNNPVYRMLQKDIPIKTLQDSRAPQLFVNAVQVEDRENYIFTGEALTYETITASTCIMKYFNPMVINGKHYVDGYYKGSNPPVKVLQEETGCTDIIVVTLNPRSSRHIPRSAKQVEKFESEMLASSGLWKDLRQIERRNERIKQGLEQGQIVHVHLIEMAAPPNMGVNSKVNTSPQFLNKLRNMGRKAYDAWYRENSHKIGKESSFFTFDREERRLIKKLDHL